MSTKIVRLNSILTAIMLFLYAGCGILNFMLSLLRNSALNYSTISLPSGVFLCLAVMLPTVVLLIYGIKQVKQKQGKADLIFSIPTLIVSVIWIVLAVLNWGITLARSVIIELYYRMDIAMSLADLLTLLSYLNVAYMLFTTIIALYLLVIYLIRVLCTKQKWLQIKAELHKPAAAVLILVPNLLSFVSTFLNPIFNRMGTDALIKFSQIYLYISFGITTLLSIALAVFVLVFGLIIKKRPAAKAQASKAAAQPSQEKPADLPFNVPAGVNADDL